MFPQRLFRLFCVLSLLVMLGADSSAQEVGDRYILSRPGKEIPGHPASGDHAVSVRFPDGSTATITAKDAGNGWLEVEVSGVRAWIIDKYLGEKIETGVATQPS